MASADDGWDVKQLMDKLKGLSQICQKLHMECQEWLIEYSAAKVKMEGENEI